TRGARRRRREDAAPAEAIAAAADANGAAADAEGAPAQAALGDRHDGASPPGSGAHQTGADGGVAEAPSDAVLSEALASRPPAVGDGGADLEPGADEELQRNVQEALDHAPSEASSRRAAGAPRRPGASTARRR